MKHLTTIELLALLNGTTSAPEHFTTCDVCVGRAASIKELQTEFTRTAAMGGTYFLSHVEVPATPKQSEREGGDDCVENDEIAEYMEGLSSRPEFIKKHLQACDRCFEAAGYYFAESQNMRKAVETEANERFIKGALNLQPRRKVKSAGQFRLPRWIVAPLPAYATAALLWFAISYGLTAPQVTFSGSAPQYTVYQKKSGTMPLYYFGVTGKKVSVQPAKMRVKSTRREMSFYWEPVESVTTYYFVLQEIRGGAPRIVKNVATTENKITLRRELFLPNVKYRWIVAGGLPPDKYFDGRLEFSVK